MSTMIYFIKFTGGIPYIGSGPQKDENMLYMLILGQLSKGLKSQAETRRSRAN